MTAKAIKVAAAVFAAVAVVLAAGGSVFAGHGKKDGGENFDWLRAENGRGIFRDGFATANPAEAAVFVVTGHAPQTITLTLGEAEYRAVLRSGKYLSHEENPDTSKDIPASAEVFGDDGRRLFAAKGYKFMEARAEKAAIVIRYWRGVMGCGLVDYHLQPEGKNLTLAKAQLISSKDYLPCGTE